jgi:hypothetical protein
MPCASVADAVARTLRLPQNVTETAGKTQRRGVNAASSAIRPAGVDHSENVARRALAKTAGAAKPPSAAGSVQQMPKPDGLRTVLRVCVAVQLPHQTIARADLQVVLVDRKLVVDRLDRWAARPTAPWSPSSPGSIWMATTCSAVRSSPSYRNSCVVAVRTHPPAVQADRGLVDAGQTGSKATAFVLRGCSVRREMASFAGEVAGRSVRHPPMSSDVRGASGAIAARVAMVRQVGRRGRIVRQIARNRRPTRRFNLLEVSLVSTRSRVNRPPSRHGAGFAVFRPQVLLVPVFWPGGR